MTWLVEVIVNVIETLGTINFVNLYYSNFIHINNSNTSTFGRLTSVFNELCT